MDDLWKFVFYALAVGVYYFIKNRKPADKTAGTNPAKPFMSPAASPEANTRPNPVKPRTPANEMPTSLEDLLRRFTGDQPPVETRPQPMLEDKVRQANQQQRPEQQNRSLEGPSLEQTPDERSMETVGYDDNIPQYKNEAADVDYEIPEKATYKGLNDPSKDRFKEFDLKLEKTNRYAALLKNPDTLRDAFVLSEILRRKEF